MIKIINSWIIHQHIKTALWVYGPGAGLHTPEDLTTRKEKLLRDLEGAARMELITPQQYRKLRARIPE